MIQHRLGQIGHHSGAGCLLGEDGVQLAHEPAQFRFPLDQRGRHATVSQSESRRQTGHAATRHQRGAGHLGGHRFHRLRQSQTRDPHSDDVQRLDGRRFGLVAVDVGAAFADVHHFDLMGCDAHAIQRLAKERPHQFGRAAGHYNHVQLLVGDSLPDGLLAVG